MSEETTTTTKIKVTKVKLGKDDTLDLEYDEIITSEETGPILNQYVLKGGNKPHNDLLRTLEPLKLHVARICEQLPGEGKMKVNGGGAIVEAITVTGVTIGGSDETEGVTIVAKRKLTSDKTLNLDTPFQKWEDEAYKYANDLQSDISYLLAECEEYIRGKYAPNEQKDLFEDEQVDEKAA